MHSTPPHAAAALNAAEQGSVAEHQWLAERIRHAAHLLPAQGPIDVFIHHNTLHAFEHHTFDEAVRTGAQVFGCEPYLAEDRYREELGRGRILSSELRAVLAEDLGPAASQIVHATSTRFELRMAMLEHPLRSGGRHELAWVIAETDALVRARRDVSEVQRRRWITHTRHWGMRHLRGSRPRGHQAAWSDALFARYATANVEEWSEPQWEAFTLSALWGLCREGARVAAAQTPPAKIAVRPRDLLCAAGAMDSDLLVNEVLIRLGAAFLDQGVARSPMPERERGLFHAFCALYREGGLCSPWWFGGLREEIARIQAEHVGALACIGQSLRALGIQASELHDFLSATLLSLRGWGGMMWHVEQRPDRVPRAIPEDSLIDWVAVRLLLERFAVPAVARRSLGYDGPTTSLRSELAYRLAPSSAQSEKQRAFLVFQVAQVLGWTPDDLSKLDAAGWSALFHEVESFTEIDRRRVFHLAYERRLRVQVLDALASRAGNPGAPPPRPSFQAVFCIDEREESIRRHVEELVPTAETFGAAGFFGVVMYYRSVEAAHFVPLCPVVVRPQHWVSEVVDERLLVDERRRSSTRRRLGIALERFHGGSLQVVSGAVLSAVLGVLTTVPLVVSVMFPRLTLRLTAYFGRLIAAPRATHLRLERSAAAPSSAHDGQGFLPEEMTNIAERLLRDIALTRVLARLVVIVGHGSSSINNPHESAHDCGACGGGVGGPNARAAAHMLNDVRVRDALRERGLEVPADTLFLGALHNTANDQLTFFDLDRVPATHQADVESACHALRAASVRNARERARRFGSASLLLSPADAKQHVEVRSHDLSQVRPEWGHATNAICVVGRRRATRGLYLDRRAFLVSYDPTQDDETSTILARILAAVVPVCAGINLEYYFSSVDSPGWGCGSKLPHNITGLLGVMDGAMSDLRTGLPWQMVEIHEPVRLLFVIETTAPAFGTILDNNPAIRALVTNLWVQVALMDPATGELSVYRRGAFETHVPTTGAVPIAESSEAWYAGRRDHLEPAEIQSPN